jgi:Family of unknown function (DUF5681)
MDDDNGDEYSIGYRKPPIASRFKQGVSGNPKGRPRGSRNIRSAAQKVFTSEVVVRQGGRTRRITKIEAIFLKQSEKALQGSERAAQMLTQWAEKLGLFREGAGEPLQDFSKLTDEELQLLERLVSKITIGPA